MSQSRLSIWNVIIKSSKIHLSYRVVTLGRNQTKLLNLPPRFLLVIQPPPTYLNDRRSVDPEETDIALYWVLSSGKTVELDSSIPPLLDFVLASVSFRNIRRFIISVPGFISLQLKGKSISAKRNSQICCFEIDR